MSFRSTPPLLGAAAALIARNRTGRVEKARHTFRGEPELPPVVIHEETCGEEAEAVVERLVR